MSLAISTDGLYNLSKSSTVDSTVAASALALAVAVATSLSRCGTLFISVLAAHLCTSAVDLRLGRTLLGKVRSNLGGLGDP
jgi:hypothetical protein